MRPRGTARRWPWGAGSLVLEQALGAQGVDYDSAAFAWIGQMTRTGAVPVFFTWHTSPTRHLDDARTRETILGAAGAAGNNVYIPALLNRYAGTRFKIVTGYPGSAEIHIAMERGEVEAGPTIWSELKLRRAHWMKERLINPLFAIAAERLPELPELPTVVDAAKTQEGREVLNVLAGGELGRAVFTAPRVPPERVEALRRAFLATLDDEAYKADALSSGLFSDGQDGAKLQHQVIRILATHKPVLELAAKARR